jgi:MFS family permease
MRVFPAKWILISTVTIFETGSLICGVSQNVNQLIVGRTVSGMGAAGMCAFFMLPESFSVILIINVLDNT